MIVTNLPIQSCDCAESNEQPNPDEKCTSGPNIAHKMPKYRYWNEVKMKSLRNETRETRKMIRTQRKTTLIIDQRLPWFKATKLIWASVFYDWRCFIPILIQPRKGQPSNNTNMARRTSRSNEITWGITWPQISVESRNRLTIVIENDKCTWHWVNDINCNDKCTSTI